MRNFESKALDWSSEIWLCDADGGNARPVIQGEGYCVCPTFLPKKGSDLSFCYVSYEQGQPRIFKASLSLPKGISMIPLRGSQVLPSISQTGSQIAFITDVMGPSDLFVQNLDEKGMALGKARQLFSTGRSTQASPTYSPDGKKVAFVSDKDGPPRIYCLDVVSPKHTQKPKPELLTKKNRENTSPSWSPDGKKLAYSAKTEGVRQIWLYDFETREEIQLTSGPENKENPVWAPNSLHLIYNTESEDVCELYLMNLNNLEPVKISRGPGQKRFASWETR
jgi:TolB protein